MQVVLPLFGSLDVRDSVRIQVWLRTQVTLVACPCEDVANERPPTKTCDNVASDCAEVAARSGKGFHYRIFAASDLRDPRHPLRSIGELVGTVQMPRFPWFKLFI